MMTSQQEARLRTLLFVLLTAAILYINIGGCRPADPSKQRSYEHNLQPGAKQ